MNKTAVIFSGQGAQAPGMGKDVYEYSEAARKLFDAGEKLLPGVTDMCFNGDAEELKKTEWAQPALLLTELALFSELIRKGVKANGIAGFSLGEISALGACGVLSYEDTVRLVIARSKKMSELSSKKAGGMVAALKLDDKTVESICREFSEVWAVNYNCPGQVSCSGDPEQLKLFSEKIKAAGGRAIPLAVSGAFHTPFMKDAENTLFETLSAMQVNSPEITLYSNITAKPYPSDTAEIIKLVSAQVASPVRFSDILKNMKDSGFDSFIEVGAGATLSGFVKRTLNDVKIYTVTDLPSLERTAEELSEAI